MLVADVEENKDYKEECRDQNDEKFEVETYDSGESSSNESRWENEAQMYEI